MPREKIFDELVIMTFRLEPAQREALRTAAKVRKISGSELLRHLIDTHIIEAGEEGEKSNGIGESL